MDTPQTNSIESSAPNVYLWSCIRRWPRPDLLHFVRCVGLASPLLCILELSADANGSHYRDIRLPDEAPCIFPCACDWTGPWTVEEQSCALD